MKKIKKFKKLTLNKEMVSGLSEKKQDDIKGGYPTPLPSWFGRCTKHYECP